MEQRESLKRQIDLLQSLIDKHKSVHGNMPRLPEGSASRGRSQSAFVMNPHRPYALPSHDTWRKTYSLKNKNPVSTVSTSSPELHSDVGETSATSETSTSSSEGLPHKKKGQTASTGIQNIATQRSDSGPKVAAEPQPLLLAQSTRQQRHRRMVEETVPKAKGSSESCSSPKAPPRLHTPKSQTDKSEARRPEDINHLSPGPGASAQASPSKLPKEAFKEPPLPQQRRAAGRQTKSKFTWVKNQTFQQVQSRPSSSVDSHASEDVKGKSGAKTCALLSPVPKRTPGKKSRKLSPVSTGVRTSKYKWVSSSAGLQVKTLRKSSSPKSPVYDHRAPEKGDAAKKLKSGFFTPPRLKRGFAASSSSSSTSRYHWKAAGLRSLGTAVDAGALRRSAFVWAAEKSTKGAKKGLAWSNLAQCSATHSSPGAFKLRSRMKIIRKSASSPNGNGPTKGGVSPAAKHSPRGLAHSLARRTPTRELVSFGRHKLRRLSPTSSRTSQAFSFHRTPAWQRSCRSQYKMVSQPGPNAPYALPYQAALSWRAKKIQSARTFLQNRQKSSLNRYPAASHHWKQSGMCWIRGHLYRVSANKLSRTVSHNMSINRTGRSFSQASTVTSPTNHPYSPRHLASRAVQRSLAIIRQARQKKQRQYCMYYNRFGKCNRGSSCTYIHDPDKVAVCTRFLRGTCKQADGACPFSHKVAKEKMPVCSYFLKGICNNSNCPYSHVYVSRKAKVCEDFVKGYCPEGQKCKKKHTLVCPDFSKTGSCPQGARCKLQHRQGAKRSGSSRASADASQPSKRPCLSVVIPRGGGEAPATPAAADPRELPSFISLSSSPEEAEAPEPAQAKSAPLKEKKLQIKPRL